MLRLDYLSGIGIATILTMYYKNWIWHIVNKGQLLVSKFRLQICLKLNYTSN